MEIVEKKVIALAQTYFCSSDQKARNHRKEYSMLTEDEKKILSKKSYEKGNYSLNQTAKSWS